MRAFFLRKERFWIWLVWKQWPSFDKKFIWADYRQLRLLFIHLILTLSRNVLGVILHSRLMSCWLEKLSSIKLCISRIIVYFLSKLVLFKRAGRNLIQQLFSQIFQNVQIYLRCFKMLLVMILELIIFFILFQRSKFVINWVIYCLLGSLRKNSLLLYHQFCQVVTCHFFLKTFQFVFEMGRGCFWRIVCMSCRICIICFFFERVLRRLVLLLYCRFVL